jgi:hypothetical protein
MPAFNDSLLGAAAKSLFWLLYTLPNPTAIIAATGCGGEGKLFESASQKCNQAI